MDQRGRLHGSVVSVTVSTIFARAERSRQLIRLAGEEYRQAYKEKRLGVVFWVKEGRPRSAKEESLSGTAQDSVAFVAAIKESGAAVEGTGEP
jgi:hypothetical protein